MGPPPAGGSGSPPPRNRRAFVCVVAKNVPRSSVTSLGRGRDLSWPGLKSDLGKGLGRGRRQEDELPACLCPEQQRAWSVCPRPPGCVGAEGRPEATAEAFGRSSAAPGLWRFAAARWRPGVSGRGAGTRQRPALAPRCRASSGGIKKFLRNPDVQFTILESCGASDRSGTGQDPCSEAQGRGLKS